jgi:hypothetical protein
MSGIFFTTLARGFKHTKFPQKMKKFYRFLLVSSVLLFGSSEMFAQFTISGEFRPRLEYRNGYTHLGDSTMHGYADILGRSRISFDYHSDRFATSFSLQHAFTFGENNFSSDTISKNTVNIFEAWFRYNFTKSFAMRVGRAVLSYDDQRLLGASNWRQWGSTHDVVNIFWEHAAGQYKMDFGFAINNMAPTSAFLNSYTLKNYKYMSYLWNEKHFFNNMMKITVLGIIDACQKNPVTTSGITTQTLWVTNGQDTVGSTVIKNTVKTTEYFPNTVYARGTIGANLWFDWKHLSIFLSGYYQGGHFKDGRKLNAGFYGGNISYQVAKPLRLLVGYEHLSGNDFSDTTGFKTKVKGFSTLWGTNHSLYGYMDMFSSYLGQDALFGGLNDLFGKATATFSAKTSLEATYRWFSLPFGYLPATVTKKNPLPYQNVSKDLGSELDLMFIYKPIPNLELNAAYCLYFKTTTREILDNLATGTGRIGQFGYVMITYKPNFFNSDKK